VLVKRDNDLISANFKDLQEFTLLSPAFRNPSTVPLRFLDGTAGPTDDSTLRKFETQTNVPFVVDQSKTASCGRHHQGTIG